MPMPGAGDSYFYEWYVGLENVIKMLNSDSGIRCVIFQHDEYDTIDDVVVEYANGDVQMCYQVKHNIETAAPKSLTFGKMIEVSEDKKCLFEAMFQGWEKACSTSDSLIKPILFTNRKIHNRRASRSFNGQTYSAYPADKFISKMQTLIAESVDSSNLIFTDDALEYQWNELCSVFSNIDVNELVRFISNLQIKGNQRDLKEMKQSLIELLIETFSCNDGIAVELLGRLLLGLTEWTTTGRKNREVTIEDVYYALGVGEEVDESQHRLTYPYPFFESRRSFCDTIIRQIGETNHKIVFISGDPGSGKTSTISFLQSEYNLFSLRYHTFKPISPEQHFYNSDPGMCTAENLWGTLLKQLRKQFNGRLAEHHVPVSNKLLSVDEMRSHVIRLLDVLGKEAVSEGEKVYICIDGIDHAARANVPVTFLPSLPLPSEIPDGVCLVIAGQPIAMYKDQYPIWLSSDAEIEKISMPKLGVGDILQLILSKANQFESAANELANLIFQKTEGNNLSTVFAVEEIRQLCNLDEVVAKLQRSSICGDIQQYYSHIWSHMQSELSRIVQHVMFPESIVACPLLLMNGRVNTRILATALDYRITQTEWSMILDRLHPLVVQTNTDGEYSLFHNDFRVFLMGVIHPYQARYEEIALSLAEYLLKNNEGILSYVMGIPLLQCAQKEELIPQYFTAEFIVNALAEGVSKERLDEFAHLSYNSAYRNRDYNGYRNTYLAVKTLYQHKRYFEYFEKKYKSNDHPEISSIHISEIRTVPVNAENLNEYIEVLELCGKLFDSTREEHKERALRLYHKWFQEYSPISFVPLCTDTISEENAWELESTEIGIFLQHWGSLAAKLNIPTPDIKKDLGICERYALFIFGEQYFGCCIDSKKYDLAIGALKSGYVSQQTFSGKLEDIYFAGAACKFTRVLTNVTQSEKEPEWSLLALSMMVTCDQMFLPDSSVLDMSPTINRIYDQSCFILVLKAFLLGCIKKDIDDATLICCADECCVEIDGEKTEKEQAAFLARVAVLLGKYYWVCDSLPDIFQGYSEWLLSASLQRSIDYSKARRFLIYTLLHSKSAKSIGGTESFINAIRTSLFEIDLLGMYYKSYILDFLVDQNRHDIIKEYINALYGENCRNISIEEQKGDMHERFRPYGELVEPEMMQQFTAQLKWDVVGYLGYKEYALQTPLDCFEIIANNVPFRWKDLGAQLYEQSEIAALYSNSVSYKIDDCVAKAAIMCGIDDYWELRNWGEKFRLDPKQIYSSLFDFIEKSTELEELQVIWILNCGINSWYTQSERQGVKSIYYACLNKARDLNIDFTSFVSQITPQWGNIIMHLSEEQKGSDKSKEYQTKRSEEKSALYARYDDLSVDESLESLTTIERTRWAAEHYSVVLEKVLDCNEEGQQKLAKLLHSFCAYLQGKEWTYENYDQIIIPLLSKMGWDAFWALAESNSTQLSDYDYQTSTRNMQLLFKLKCYEDLAEMESLLNEELRTQRIWVTGYNHFEINNLLEHSEIQFVDAPKSLVDMTLYILLEQADTQNARKLESAIYAIYLLGLQFPTVMNVIVEKWDRLSQNQEACLLPVIAKWAAEGICSKALHVFLLDMYNDCSELSQKYYLHSILLMLNESSIEDTTVCCTAPSINYEIPKNSVVDRRNCYENFLSMVEKYTGKLAADAIRCCLFEISPLENYKKDRFGECGDSRIPAINKLPGYIFYDKEKCGEWTLIPLANKKARLIPPEDPFMLTEMPCMVFDPEWFPDITATHDGKKNRELTTSDLQNISHSCIGENEIVLAASLWYPWGHKDGTIYTESTKIDLPIKTNGPVQFDLCLGNYGLLASEEAVDECCRTAIGTGGRSLFNRVCGCLSLFFGNCQLAPSSIWRELFRCRPKSGDPYTWVDDKGREVLRYERIASPIREAMREAYIRQPILFRWICNETWLTTFLQNENLRLYPICTQEPYPALMD